MSVSDRGYALLLTHLHNPTSSLPLPTIQGALAHHLATLSPLPTPLAATAISSPFYLSQPLTHTKLISLTTAFRHATHLKFRETRDAGKSKSRFNALFRKTLAGVVDQWVTDVLKGVQGGHPVLRLACCSGLLLGVEDLKRSDHIELGRARGGLEDETVVSLAEVMDAYAFGVVSGTPTGVEEWEREFQPAGQDVLSLALILASQSLPLVSQTKLRALPLPVLARLLTSTISATFKSGTFLSSLSASTSLTPEQHVHISTSSPLAQTLQSMSSSPLTASIPSISRLTADTLALLLDSTTSRIDEGMRTVSDTLKVLCEMSTKIETDWSKGAFASATEDQIDLDTMELTKSIWTTLKTLLFSNVMLFDAVLSAVVFVPPYYSAITPSFIALQTLHTLSHFSFVISQFGGVTSTSKGFEELKKTFYLALDILAQGDGHSGAKADAYVEEACFSLQRTAGAAKTVHQAKQAFVLASIEQLVPVLSDKCIRNWVWGACYAHLSDPTHRETYESAHSVVLAIFSSHAQKQHGPRQESSLASTTTAWKMGFFGKSYGRRASITPPGEEILDAGSTEREGKVERAGGSAPHSSDEHSISESFAKRMVPFYAQCLIENSVQGRLSTPQLRLAYSALVRSACVSAYAFDGPPDETYSLAWYCVQLILDKLRDLTPLVNYVKGKRKAQDNDEDRSIERVHRLHLVLISMVSSLPLSLMLRVLEEIRVILTTYPRPDGGVDGDDKVAGEGQRKELVEALFSEFLEGVGDREKEAAITWWYKHRPTLISGEEKEEEKGKGTIGSFVRGLKGVRKDLKASVNEELSVTGQTSQSDTGVVSRL